MVKHFNFQFQIHKTVFETKIEKRCNIEFEKVCVDSFKQQPVIETIHVCTTTPERKCNLTIETPFQAGLVTSLTSGLEEQCNDHYKTVCETKFEEKEVMEEVPICNDVMAKSCNGDDENCVEFMKRVMFKNIEFLRNQPILGLPL